MITHDDHNAMAEPEALARTQLKMKPRTSSLYGMSAAGKENGTFAVSEGEAEGRSELR